MEGEEGTYIILSIKIKKKKDWQCLGWPNIELTNVVKPKRK